MSSLVVLDRAVTNKGPDPYRTMQEQSWTREVFGLIMYTTDLERALAAARRDPTAVVVIGPSFLKAHPGREDALITLFAETGLPTERLVLAPHLPGFGMALRHKGEYVHESIPSLIFGIMGLREVRP